MLSLLLAAAKFGAYWFTGSVLVLASFLDSISDAAISLVNSWVQRLSRDDPDREHPFGHGGIAVISSLLQALVLLGFGIYLLYQSLARLDGAHRSELHIEGLLPAAAVMMLSSLGALAVQIYLKRNARRLREQSERSLALLADQSHYFGDAWSNLLGAVGLVTVWYTKLPILDAVFGLFGALILFRAAYPVLLHSVRDILQNEADPKLQQHIVDMAMASDGRILGVHRLRTRESGPTLFVDFHLKLPSAMILEEAHGIGERVTRAIRAQIPRADVIIHLDPDSEPDDDHWRPAYKQPL